MLMCHTSYRAFTDGVPVLNSFHAILRNLDTQLFQLSESPPPFPQYTIKNEQPYVNVIMIV
jgi:hypothetical protein